MVALGIDQLLDPYRHLIDHKRIGLISNYPMTDSQLVPVIDRLQEHPDTTLVRLFGPEHGVLNAAREGEHVPFAEDPHTGLPVISLYGDLKAPTPDMLEDLDALVIDLQDIGTRYYTNPSTLYYAVEAADTANIPLIVLDRPNPLGGQIREGRILDSACRSFVGMLPVPVRHGLTFGEEARLIQCLYFPDAEVEVVPMSGWKRSMLWPETGLPFVPPSPNTTNFTMTLLYPGTCLFEGTNVSVGRGTPHPFEWIGAPWVDGHTLADWFNQQHLPGVVARPVYFTPARSLYTGDLVSGVQVHVTDPGAVQALKTGVMMLLAFVTLYPEKFTIATPEDTEKRHFFDLLAGGTALKEAILARDIAPYFELAQLEVRQFHQEVQPYLIYPPEEASE